MDKLEGKAESKNELATPDLPIWSCELSTKEEGAFTVGELRSLKCTGFDFVPTGETYSLKLEEGKEHFLKILSTKTDEQSLKEFEVTSYAVVQGDLNLIFLQSGKEIFKSSLKGLSLKSVVKNPMKPKAVGPMGGYYVLPSGYQLVAIGVAVLAMVAILTMRAVAKARKRNEFRRIIAKARYVDPFMDFNIELRDYAKQKKSSVLFLDQLEESIKKIFFRIFNENISLNKLPLLVKRLKGLGLEPHEVRMFYVLEEEYKKFKSLYKESKGQVFEEKKDFLDQAKKAVNKLKPYVDARG